MARNQHPFKVRDVVRAMRSAEKGGLSVGHVEVVTKDGTTIRVFGAATAPKTEWDEATAKLQANG